VPKKVSAYAIAAMKITVGAARIWPSAVPVENFIATLVHLSCNVSYVKDCIVKGAVLPAALILSTRPLNSHAQGAG
jgi:hypothetical protein